MSPIEILGYRPEWRHYFEQLNKAWLEEYFSVEPIDRWVLENPEEAILKGGGTILFARLEGRIIGAVALKYSEDGGLELIKMAVDKPYRGRGAGKMLCQAAIRKAAEMGAPKLILYSQTGLPAAIAIYRKMGFREVPLDANDFSYERANIKMELELEASQEHGRKTLPGSAPQELTQNPAGWKIF
ncbi:MAG: GNAT family N-acetyltransferase [Lewinellaceae bacterium]|nr:GNAT family N-acetyltransferase [Lewinellaceae bacterium]